MQEADGVGHKSCSSDISNHFPVCCVSRPRHEICHSPAGPGGSKTGHLTLLELDNIKELYTLQSLFQNLRIAYLKSRIYVGTTTTGMTPQLL